MKQNELYSVLRRVVAIMKSVLLVLVILLGAVVYLAVDYSVIPTSQSSELTQTILVDDDLVTDGIHVKTGLLDGKGLDLVIMNCTNCHSAKMITQNRATKEGWKSMIRWMQETQNLWDLGENEEAILEYLSTNYAPQKKGRRSRLENVEWYALD